jgi:CPA1 family monovalent cation:H+ antiporter
VHVALNLVILAVVVTAFSELASRYRISAPLLLVVVGVVASYVPFVPDVELSPELVLVGFLPPLLYAAALRTSLL